MITGSPGSSYQLWIVDNFNNSDPSAVYNYFYDELMEDISDIVITENIDEIMLLGSQEFMQGLAKQLKDKVPEDIIVFTGE